MSSEAIVRTILKIRVKAMRAYKKLAEKAIAQLKDEEFFVTLDEEVKQRRRGHETHGRQHVLALDRLSDFRRRETESQSRLWSL